MTFKLTQENYFDPNRPHVSNSQIGDYLKDPGYYKARHIDRTIEFKVTDPMKIGSMVDEILTQDNNPYQTKVLKREDAAQFETQKTLDPRYLMTPAAYKKAWAIADHVNKQPFWTSGLEDAEFQTVLTSELHGTPVCGLTDRIDELKDGKYRISDLKVVSPIKISSPEKWIYNAIEMGYIRQAALYRYLFAQQYELNEEDIEFCHIVATQLQEGLCGVKLFRVSPELMEEAMDEIYIALRGIKAKQFDSPQVTWNEIKNL